MGQNQGLNLPVRSSPRRNYSPRGLVVLLALMAAAAAGGCQPASRASSTATAGVLATTTPAPMATSTLAAAPTEAYPAATAESAATPDPSTAYPGAAGEPGPSGVIAIENSSIITARLISMAPDAERPDLTRLRVEVLTSENVPGMQNFTLAKVHEEIDILARTSALPDLQPGENVKAEVSYRGDEHGGIFSAKEVKKQGP